MLATRMARKCVVKRSGRIWISSKARASPRSVSTTPARIESCQYASRQIAVAQHSGEQAIGDQGLVREILEQDQRACQGGQRPQESSPAQRESAEQPSTDQVQRQPGQQKADERKRSRRGKIFDHARQAGQRQPPADPQQRNAHESTETGDNGNKRQLEVAQRAECEGFHGRQHEGKDQDSFTNDLAKVPH